MLGLPLGAEDRMRSKLNHSRRHTLTRLSHHTENESAGDPHTPATLFTTLVR